MEKYKRVEKPRPDVPIMDNEIRIGTQGMPRKYVTHALTLLTERGKSTVVLKALGNAISKAVTVAEIVKRRIPNLNHNKTISSTRVTDNWEPVEEGLLPLETMRRVSIIIITLSTKQLDTSSTGYQIPVKPILGYVRNYNENGFGRGQCHGEGRNGGNGEDGWQVVSRSRGRGMGRGRARGGSN